MQGEFVVLFAGVVITLAFFLLIGYTVRIMGRSEATSARLAVTLVAVGSAMAALPAILYAIYGL